jgi:hypothetical protein
VGDVGKRRVAARDADSQSPVIALLLAASVVAQVICPAERDTLWRILASGEVASGCAGSRDSILLSRDEGEPASAFLRRAGNILVAAGAPEQGLVLLSRARTAGGPRDSLLAETSEALLALGRIEQAVAATYALDDISRSPVLLRQRSKMLRLVGMPEEARQAQRSADSLDPPVSRWVWDRRPEFLAALSGRDDREERKTDPAFARRRLLQEGLNAGTSLAVDPSDTSTYAGRSTSQFALVQWGGGSESWRFDASMSAWSVLAVPDPESPPWGVGGSLALRRVWPRGWWSKVSGGMQRSWRGRAFEEDDYDGMVASGWSHGSFSTSLAHRQYLSVAETNVPSNTTSLSCAFAPSRGPRWNATGSLGWSGGEDSRLEIPVPATIWRTIGVQEGARLWRDDRHPPSWTLIDPTTGVPMDSARMVSFYYGARPRPVPQPDPSDFTLVEFRPARYWSPSLSLGLTQDLPWKFQAGAGVSTGWRLWTRSETILLADPWTPLENTGYLVLARDEATGNLFLVTDPKGGTFVDLDETRRRRDHWTPISLTLSWTPLSWSSLQVGWQATETGTNTADIDSTVASTGSTWSASVYIWW